MALTYRGAGEGYVIFSDDLEAILPIMRRK